MICTPQLVFPPLALRPNAGHGLLILDVSRSHTTTHHSRQDSSGRVISSSQRPIPDNTQHSQQTNIHAPGGIRTHDLSRRAAADLRLRPRGYWDRPSNIVRAIKQSRMRWAGHEARMRERGGVYVVLIGKLEGKMMMMMMMMIIVIIIIIIIIINCTRVVTRWQWLIYMYTKYEIGYYQI